MSVGGDRPGAMTDDTTLRTWMDSYLRAWTTNDRSDIAALFTEDAVYRTAPFDEPRVGHDAIIAGWVDDEDAPDAWSFEWQPLVSSGHVVTITGETRYTSGRHYSNLWVMRFAPDGRCMDYTEWYMEHDRPST